MISTMIKWIFCVYVSLTVLNPSNGLGSETTKKAPSFNNRFLDVYASGSGIVVYNSDGERHGLSYAAAEKKCINDGGQIANVVNLESDSLDELGDFLEATDDWNGEPHNRRDRCRAGAVWVHAKSYRNVEGAGALTCGTDSGKWRVVYYRPELELPFLCQFDKPCAEDANPCKNAGRCVRVPRAGASYMCDCSQTKYTGVHCEEVAAPVPPPHFAAQGGVGGVLDSVAERNFNTSELDSIKDGITPSSLAIIGWMCACAFIAIVASIGGGYVICFKRKKLGGDMGGSRMSLGSQGNLSAMGSMADIGGGSQADLAAQGSFANFT